METGKWQPKQGNTVPHRLDHLQSKSRSHQHEEGSSTTSSQLHDQHILHRGTYYYKFIHVCISVIKWIRNYNRGVSSRFLAGRQIIISFIGSKKYLNWNSNFLKVFKQGEKIHYLSLSIFRVLSPKWNLHQGTLTSNYVESTITVFYIGFLQNHPVTRVQD